MVSKEIRYEIIQHYGIISTSNAGWNKEINLIRWNERPAKIDIRDWSPDHSKMGKGITLTDEDAKKLIDILRSEV